MYYNVLQRKKRSRKDGEKKNMKEKEGLRAGIFRRNMDWQKDNREEKEGLRAGKHREEGWIESRNIEEDEEPFSDLRATERSPPPKNRCRRILVIKPYKYIITLNEGASEILTLEKQHTC